MDTNYSVIGINGDESQCSCCGKAGLSKVVWLAKLDTDGSTSEVLPVGTTCAAYLLRITKEKGVRSTRKIEAAIEAKLLESVNAKIADIRKSFVTYADSYLVPADSDFSQPTELIFAARDSRFPILRYLNGEINLKQAAEYLEAR